jgi:hypothetical protein
MKTIITLLVLTLASAASAADLRFNGLVAFQEAPDFSSYQVFVEHLSNESPLVSSGTIAIDGVFYEPGFEDEYVVAEVMLQALPPWSEYSYIDAVVPALVVPPSGWYCPSLESTMCAIVALLIA